MERGSLCQRYPRRRFHFADRTVITRASLSWRKEIIPIQIPFYPLPTATCRSRERTRTGRKHTGALLMASRLGTPSYGAVRNVPRGGRGALHSAPDARSGRRAACPRTAFGEPTRTGIDFGFLSRSRTRVILRHHPRTGRRATAVSPSSGTPPTTLNLLGAAAPRARRLPGRRRLRGAGRRLARPLRREPGGRRVPGLTGRRPATPRYVRMRHPRGPAGGPGRVRTIVGALLGIQRHADPGRRHGSRARRGDAPGARGHRRRVRVGRPARRRRCRGAAGDAAARRRAGLDPPHEGRDQGPDHDARRHRLPHGQRGDAQGARPLRAGAPVQELRRRALALRGRRPGDRAREHRGPLRRHRVRGRHATTAPS